MKAVFFLLTFLYLVYNRERNEMNRWILINILFGIILSGDAFCAGDGTNGEKESIKVRKFLTDEERREYVETKWVQPFLKRWNIGVLDQTPAADYVWKDDPLDGLLVGDILLSIEVDDKDPYGLRYYTIVENSTGKHLGRMTAQFIRPPCSLGKVRQEAVYQMLSQGSGILLARKGITHRFYGRDSWRMLLNNRPFLWCEGNFVGMIFSMADNDPESPDALVKAVNSAVRKVKKEGVEFHPDWAAKWRNSQREIIEERWRARSERRKEEDRTLGLPAWLHAIVATPKREWKWWKNQCRIVDFPDPLTENRKLTCRLPLSCMEQLGKDQKILVEKKSQGWVIKITRDNGFLLVAASEMENSDLARGMMIRFRFFDYKSPHVGIYRTYNQQYLSEEHARSSTVIHPGKVGDFDLGIRPWLSPSGTVVPNSENSAVYFSRGTTAVMIVTTIPNMSVLPLARKLDGILLKQKADSSGKAL